MSQNQKVNNNAMFTALNNCVIKAENTNTKMILELSEEYRTEIFNLTENALICSISIGLDGQIGFEPRRSRDHLTQWEGYKLAG